MLRSDCCDAPIVGEVDGEGEEDACGRCGKCKEMAGVYDDKANISVMEARFHVKNRM